MQEIETPEEIYLLDFGDEWCACDDPAPDYADRNHVKYIRADVVEAKLNKEVDLGKLAEAIKDCWFPQFNAINTAKAAIKEINRQRGIL